ncbi:MAG: hypothetical protein HOG49_13535 [Candidatus Scalindua sp.]|jgi:hypothetical protein|nr:hypothetical protein [Candidatus Scalindua sp.]
MSKRKQSKPRIVYCQICGNKFETTHSQARYCPQKCRRLGERKSWNKYNSKNKDKRKIYWDKYYKKNSETIIKKTRKYQATEAGKKAISISTKRMREKYPEKYSARMEALKAIRKGTLVKKPCEVCGEIKVEGHHEDYNKPLDVMWLCKKHHVAREKLISK